MIKFHLAIAALGTAVAQFSAEEKARLFAYIAMGVWFSVQTIVYLCIAWRRRRATRDPFTRD